MDRVQLDELKRIMEGDEDTLVVDVLPRERYEAGHIPGSVSIPLGEPAFVERVERQTTGEHQRVVVYAADAGSPDTARAVEVLRDAGFDQVSACAGGLREWQEAGMPVATGAAAL